MSQERINLILLEPSSDKLVPLIGVLEKSNQVTILRVPTPRDAAQAALQFLPCVLVVSLQDQNDGRQQLILLKTMEKPIRTGQLKVLVVSKAKFHPMARAISALGVTDYAEEPVATKSLLFKMNLMFKSIHSTRERMAEAQRKESIYRAKQDKLVTEEVKLTSEVVGSNFKPALQIGSDIFVFMGVPPKKVGRHLMLEAGGPLPETGNWVEDNSDGIEPPKWRWMPSVEDPEAEADASGEGNGWVYEGEKPVYDPQKSKWILKSERPRLSCRKNGKEVANKVEIDDFGEVSIAEDSEIAKKNIVRNQAQASQARALKLRDPSANPDGKPEQNKPPSAAAPKEGQSKEKPDSGYEEKDGSFNNLLGLGFGDSDGTPIQNKLGGKPAPQTKNHGLPANPGDSENTNRPNVVEGGKEKTGSLSLQKRKHGGLEAEKSARPRGALLKGPDKARSKALQNFREKVRSGLLLDLEKEEIAEGVLSDDQLASAANSYQERKGGGKKNYLDRQEEIKSRQRNQIQKDAEEDKRKNAAGQGKDDTNEASRKDVHGKAEERARNTLEQLKTKLRKHLKKEAEHDSEAEKEAKGQRNRPGAGKASKAKKAQDLKTKALKEKIREIEEALAGRGPALNLMFPEDEDDEGWTQDNSEGPRGPSKFRAIDSLLQDDDEEEKGDSDTDGEFGEEHAKLGTGKGINAAKARPAASTYDSKAKQKDANGAAKGKSADLAADDSKIEDDEADEEDERAAGEDEQKNDGKNAAEKKDSGDNRKKALGDKEPGAAAAEKAGGDDETSRAKSRDRTEKAEGKAGANGERNPNGKKKKTEDGIKNSDPKEAASDDQQEAGDDIEGESEDPASDKSHADVEDSGLNREKPAAHAGKERAAKEKPARPESKPAKEKSIEPEISAHQQLLPNQAAAASSKESLTTDPQLPGSQNFYLEQSEVVPLQGHWHSDAGIWFYLANKTFELGFERLEDILPFWVYSGEPKPSFQIDKKRWEFIGSAPQQVRSPMEIPVLLIEFLDELRNLFQRRTVSSKASPTAAERKALDREGADKANEQGRENSDAETSDAKNALNLEEEKSKGDETPGAAKAKDGKHKEKENSSPTAAAAEAKPELFHLKQSEVPPIEGQWHMIGGEWIFLADIVYEHGINDPGDVLPLWSYSGEKEPVLLSSNRKWEFIGVAPKKLTTVDELSEALLEFLRDLQELKRMRTGDQTAREEDLKDSSSPEKMAKEKAGAQAQELGNRKNDEASGNSAESEESGEELNLEASAEKENSPDPESNAESQDAESEEEGPGDEKIRALKNPEGASGSTVTEAPKKPVVLLHARELVVLAVVTDLKKLNAGLEQRVPGMIQALRIAFPQFAFNFHEGNQPAASAAPVVLPFPAAKGYILGNPPDARKELSVREERVFALITAAVSEMAA